MRTVEYGERWEVRGESDGDWSVEEEVKYFNVRLPPFQPACSVRSQLTFNNEENTKKLSKWDSFVNLHNNKIE